MKRLAGYTAVVLFTLMGVILLWQFRAILALFLLSLAIASAARPPVNRLMQRGFPLSLAILLTYLAGLALAAGLLFLLGTSLLAEAYDLAGAIAAAYENTWLAWMEGAAPQQAIAARLPAPSQLFTAIVGPDGELLAQRLFEMTADVSTLLGGFVVALVLSVYWTVDRARFERLWLSLLPAGQRSRARRIWQAIDEGMGAYIRSEIVQGFIGIILLYAGYLLIGLPYPALLALLGGIAWLVPLVGVVFTVAPVLAVGLMEGTALGVAAVFYTAIVLLVLELVVEPRFFNRRRYSPILTVLIMLVLIEDFGILGLIVAPPLSAAVQLFFTNLQAAQKASVLSGAISQLAALRERLTAVETMLLETGETPSVEARSIAERLHKLIAQANLVVKDKVQTTAVYSD